MTPAPDFDRIARPYLWLERLTFGRSLERCRFHFLPRLSLARRALVLGDGDGRFLARLLAQNPHLHADAVDTSRVMLHLLRKRCDAAFLNADRRLQTHHTDALRFIPRGSYDLVVTHFFLDCLSESELRALCERIRPTLHEGAVWLVSEFQIPDGPVRLPARLLVAALYTAFRWITGLRPRTLPDYASALRSLGFHRSDQHLGFFGILTSEIWRFGGGAMRDPAPPLKSSAVL